MLFKERIELSALRGRENRRSPRLDIDVDAQELACRDDLIVRKISHAKKDMKPLRIQIQKLQVDPKARTDRDLAHIVDMILQGEDRAVTTERIVFTKLVKIKKFIHRLVENHYVIGDIHVIVVIDPIGAHSSSQ